MKPINRFDVPPIRRPLFVAAGWLAAGCLIGTACSGSETNTTSAPAPPADSSASPQTGLDPNVPVPDNTTDPSAQQETDDSGSSQSETDSVQRLTPPPSPLDQVRLSDDDDRLIYETWQQAMASCMADAGFGFEIAPYELTASTRTTVRTPIEPSAVEQYGYHQPPDEDSAPLLGTNDERANTDEAFRGALFGDDSATNNGCRGTTFAQVYAEESEFFAVDQQMGRAQADISIEMMTSERVTGLNETWSACMATRGLEYTTPDEPVSSFAGAETVTAEEILTRQADLQCQLDIDYVQRSAAWLNDDVELWLDDNAETVNQYLQLKDEYLREVNQIRENL